MEIAPIAGIRVMPTIKSRPVDPELTAFFAIESTARPEEDSYTGSGRKAAGAEEPGDDEQEDLEALDDEELPTALRMQAAGTISIFA